jgi:hypothetical protein
MQVLFRWYLFYPLAAIIAALIILVSLGPAILPTDPRPVSGRVTGAMLVLSGDDLAHPAPSPETVHHVERDAAWRTKALRVAVLPGHGPVKPQEAGVQILLSPQAIAGIGPGPFRIEILTKSVPVTTAQQLAIGLSRGSTIEWQTKPITVGDELIAYDFAQMPGEPISAIAIRPVTTLEDYNYGIEVRGIRIISPSIRAR